MSGRQEAWDERGGDLGTPEDEDDLADMQGPGLEAMRPRAGTRAVS